MTLPLRWNRNVRVLPAAASLPLAAEHPHPSGWIDRFGPGAEEEEGDLNGSISVRINEATQQFHNLLKRFLHP